MNARSFIRSLFIAAKLALASGCSTTQSFEARDLLIDPNKFQVEPPLALSASDTDHDIRFLKFALNTAYSGQRFLPSSSFSEMLTRLDRVSGAMSPAQLRDRVDEILTDVPDNHLQARLNKRSSKYREDQSKPGSVGKRTYEGTNERPWSVELQELGGKKSLIVALRSFPHHQSAVWNGYLETIEATLPVAQSVIIDLRGNSGGDDTMGLETAWLLYGRDFDLPFAHQFRRTNAETEALFSNLFAFMISAARASGKKEEGFLSELYSKHLIAYENALKDAKDDYDVKEVSMVTSERPHPKVQKMFENEIFILMDSECASSCESTILAFEAHPSAKRFGENTSGSIHFGNVSPILLPRSKVMVQIPTHYTEFKDKRFIEKTGIVPDVRVKPGADALNEVTRWMGRRH